MPSMFGRKCQWSLICILLQVCFFSKNISLGEAEKVVEAIIEIKLEPTSSIFNQYFIYNDTYQLFQDYFFNKKVTFIQLRYHENRYIQTILAKEDSQYNGTFYKCKHVANNSSIECRKISGKFDTLSGNCLNGTGIQWNYTDEYLSSSHFKNYTIINETVTGVTLVCYTLNKNFTYTSTSRTLSTTNTTTTTTDNSSALPAGVIAGVSIGIFIVINIIVIIAVILRKRKQKRDSKGSTISRIQATNKPNAYNEQSFNKREENSNNNTHFTATKFEDVQNLSNSKDKSILINSYTEIDPDYAGIDEADTIQTDIKISTTAVNEDDYTYIDDNEATRNGEGISIEDDYSTLDQTIAGMDESVEQRHNRSLPGVPNYNNVGIESKNGLKETNKKKDDYSKLREKNLNFQNAYGELDKESLNGEENCPELNTDNVNGNEEPGWKRNVYSKLGEKNRDFQNTYGDIDEESLNEEKECPVVEVNNTYFVLENENTYPGTINTEK